MQKSQDATGKILGNKVSVFVVENGKIIPGTTNYIQADTRYKGYVDVGYQNIPLVKSKNDSVFLEYTDAEKALLSNADKAFTFV